LEGYSRYENDGEDIYEPVRSSERNTIPPILLEGCIGTVKRNDSFGVFVKLERDGRWVQFTEWDLENYIPYGEISKITF
jgi:hypothetical protein